VIGLGKLTEKQESRILEEIISKMGAKEGNGRIKQRRKEGTPIKRLRNKLKEPKTRLQWNIFSPYVTKS
jgi:hypothetical protein